MAEEQFRIRIILDPQPEEQEILAAWPREPLQPDFIVVAAGWVALEIGGKPLLYRNGERISPPLPAGVDPLDLPEARIGDYVALFLMRLLDATSMLRYEPLRHVHIVRFVDNPACLAVQRAGACVRVSYRESRLGADLMVARPLEYNFRQTVIDTAELFTAQLLALNPALAGHPDIVALREAIQSIS